MLQLTILPILMTILLPDYALVEPWMDGMPDGWYYRLGTAATVVGPFETHEQAMTHAEERHKAKIAEQARAEEERQRRRFRVRYRTRVMRPELN